MDLTAQVIDAINGWLRWAATELLRPALSAIGGLLFATPAFDRIPEVAQLWTLVRNVADALFVLAVIAAGVLVMASGTFDSCYTAKLVIPRVALAAVAANASLVIVGALIRLENGIVLGLLGDEPAAAVTQQLAAMLAGPAEGQFVGILVAVAGAALALLLVAISIGRDVVLLIATVLAPLALATYSLPLTDEVARLWWRVYGALLFVQVVQAVLVLVGLELLRHTDWLGGPLPDLVAGLVLVSVLYLLFRLPFAAYQWAFQRPLVQSAPARTIVFAARAALGRA
jgi:hypothetical protein